MVETVDMRKYFRKNWGEGREGIKEKAKFASAKEWLNFLFTNKPVDI